MKYIDKDTLVAEIEKRRDESWLGNYTKEKGIVFDITDDILSFINTLEVKEVDLDAEFDKYCETLYLIDLENEPYSELFECAKYFFELGLKVQKGEQYEIRCCYCF